MKKRINWKVLIASFVLVFIVEVIGGLLTATSTRSEWFQSIRPSITPPNWVFPVVWNILYIMIAISLYSICVNSKKNQKLKVRLTYGINLLLNIVWSFFFFFMKNPLLGFYTIIVLWLSIIVMLLVSWRISKTSFYLLIPYFIWVSFASIINLLSI